jgi:FkbM family methyltransferase
MEREAFLRLYAPAAKRLSISLARGYSSTPRKNAYNLLFAVLRRLHLRIPLLSKTFFGRRMHILLPEFGSCTVVENGMADIQTPLYFAAVLREGSVCFDGGANFGFYSLLARFLVGERGNVHAFEPATFAFSFLQKNLRDAKNAKLVQAAVSDSNGTLQFARRFSAIASGFNRVATAGNIASEAELISVRCLCLDTYCADTGVTPDLVKLDVEGHELASLQGMERTITTAQPFIILEYGMAEGDNIAASRFLVDRGYSAFVAEGCTIRPCSLDRIAASAAGENYLFAAPGRLGLLAEWIV